MSEETKPAVTMQTLVRHGLEILSQGLGQKLNINPAHIRPVAQSTIDRFVRENVSDQPLSLEGLFEDAGLLRRNPRRLK